MIREVIKPQYTNFTIDIPTSYIGREIEFIMFPIDEESSISQKEIEHKKSLRGVFNKYSDSLKLHLEDSAWQKNIVDRYKKDD